MSVLGNLNKEIVNLLSVLDEFRLPKDLFPIVFYGFLLCQEMILFLFFNKFIYLSLAALGLRCSVRAFSSCSEQGLLFIVVRGLLIAVASLVVEHRL